MSNRDCRLPIIVWLHDKAVVFGSSRGNPLLDSQDDYLHEEIMSEDKAVEHVAGRWKTLSTYLVSFLADPYDPKPHPRGAQN